ncbi:P-loop containing nucleoside triphosphate hydrolase protein [Piromyces finnis]|uniref:p-loop containing nucleoside triphosphate hydrolase protein n=1 Tax=Piromyces finnis TaxID=1754191 RepID=A0A1Y1U8G5_9FUNG|nr:P-loop containing nucleoside triphosphate hydrolase protein [Piromyces finnis]|eukprot:ORX34331.1 P-loop containing nucleoside triphosphate hydrolase protein [Piromyces finnis]
MGYYLNQLKALVKRNILLKKASKATIVLEIFFPIYSILCICNFILKQNSGKNESTVINSHEPTILSPLYSLFSKSYDYQYSVVGFVLPEENDGSIIPEIVGTINNDFFNSTSYIKPMQFKNQEEMVKYKTDKDKDESSYDKLLAGIVFESNDLSKYTIRLNIKDVENPETEPITNVGSIFSLTSSEELSSQYINIFSPIQSSVDQALIRMKTKDNNFSLNYSIGELGQLESNLSESDMDISASIGYYITFSFLAVVYTITLNIVKEKEDKLRDGLLIAGVHPTVFWLSWFILEGFITFIISVVFTIIIVFNNLIPNVNFIFIFLVIFLFSLSACCIGFIFSTFFKKSKTAGVVIIFFYIILCYMNQILILFNSNISRILSFIFSTVSLGLFFNSAIKLKYTYKSLGFVTIFKTDVGFYLLITLFNVVTYFLLAIILDNLISNENNRYLFTPKRKVKDLHSENEVTYQKDIQEDFNSINNEKCMVEVSRVHKLFKRDKNNSKNDNNNNNNKNQSKGKNSEFLAVNDISFKVYQNEIFALLGHNGAGKTTLINIMVGLIKATYGDVYFDGSSISKNVNAIRKDFGVCAQTNIIYDGLTVEDHINFYANLKNTHSLVVRFGELLLKKKEGRVIFLTTHYMDEADVLADRKLILNKGKIRCLGTSLYLKNHFNMKYNLDVETNEKEKVNKIIMNYLPEAIYVENKEANEFESHDNKFYTWRLPLNSSDHFAPLLNELDNLSGSLIRKLKIFLKDKMFAFNAFILPILLIALVFFGINQLMFKERIITYESKAITVPTLLIVLLFVYYFILILLDRMKNQTNKSDISELPPKTSEIYEKELENGDDDVKREYDTLHLCKEFNVSKGKITDPSEIKEIRDRDANDYTYGDIHKSIVKYNQLVKTAVVDVNFGVRLHECFGLLGPNGAVTMLRYMLLQYINAAGLEEHQNKRVDDLSGGTKRKLSILIAICGYPERILLDEPTAGMDPSTRRLIWEIIKSTKRRNDSALIMTTHSMEEAEQLCDRLAILVNGRLICIGSPEHLKMKYGKGYILELQCNDVDQFHSEVMERISNNRGKYEVKMTKKLGLVFERMEEYKKKGLVNDYSFNQNFPRTNLY